MHALLLSVPSSEFVFAALVLYAAVLEVQGRRAPVALMVLAVAGIVVFHAATDDAFGAFSCLAGLAAGAVVAVAFFRNGPAERGERALACLTGAALGPAGLVAALLFSCLARGLWIALRRFLIPAPAGRRYKEFCFAPHFVLEGDVAALQRCAGVSEAVAGRCGHVSFLAAGALAVALSAAAGVPYLAAP